MMVMNDDFLSFFFREFFQENTTIIYVSLWLPQMNNVEAAFKQSPDESSLVIFTIRFRYCNKFHFSLKFRVESLE
jgi:hypothetical protein